VGFAIALPTLRLLNEAHHDDLKTWEQENILYTMRKKRQDFLANN